jgi:protocatechuate 3,4-dioxygenase beta subunit
MLRVFVAVFLSLLCLPLFAAISGTVMTTDGAAIAGARVSIHALETHEARRTRLLSKTPDPVPLASVPSDERGSFSLASPKDAVVNLRVEMRGYEPVVRRVERDEAGVAIALRQIGMVQGRVTAGGKPVANALVAIGADFTTRSDEKGRYEAPAITPPYNIAVIHPDYAIDEELLPTDVVPAMELTRTLNPGVTLTGRVVAADGTSPVAAARISVDGWPLAVSGENGAFKIAHAPAKWTAITARKGALTGTHSAGGATMILRLEPSAVVSGRVRDAKTNAPLAGVMVGVPLSSMPWTVGPVGITDAGGAYSIAVPPGSDWISTIHPSYAGANESIRIAPGEQVTRDFALVQLARVAGTVIDEANRPVNAASISPHDAFDRGIPDMPANGATPVTSGPDGNFTVRVLPGHDFYLRVSRKGDPKSRSQVMKLEAGESKSGVVLTIPTGVAVTGRALNAGGKPLSGVAVVAWPAAAPGVGETLDTLFPPVDHDPVRTAGDGTFSIRVKEGWYNFAFRRDGFLTRQVRGQRITGSSENTIEARLDPAQEISGRVTRGGVGIADVEVGSHSGTRVVATTDSDGSFVLGGFTPGVQQLQFRKRAERVDETRSITAPARGVAIDLQRGGTIHGRVVEKGTGTPIRSFRAGVMVGLGNLSSFGSEDGSFTFDHVPAGVTTVAVNAFGYPTASREVTVVDGEAVTDLVVELRPGVRLTGRVTDTSGAPLSGVSIIIRPPDMEGGMIGGLIGGVSSRPPVPSGVSNIGAHSVTDADGWYTLDGLTPGRESVQFSHAGHTQITRKVTLQGQETKLDVQLERP